MGGYISTIYINGKITSNLKQTDELVISRTLEVPVELVWKAWTNPALFKKWWGPKDFSFLYCEMILKKDAKYLYGLQSPRGVNIWITGTYLEINPNQKLVFTASLADEKGKVVPGSYYGLGEVSNETIINVSLEVTQSRTELIVG